MLIGHAASADRQPAGDRGVTSKQEAISILATPTSTPSRTKRPPPDRRGRQARDHRRTPRTGPGLVQVLEPAGGPTGGCCSAEEVPGAGSTTFAVIALIFICDKCVANPWRSPSARSARRLHRCSRSPADIGRSRARPAATVLSREGPERRRCPRPDGTGASVAPSC